MGKYNKAIVAVVGAVAAVSGENVSESVIALATALLVYIVPNVD